MTSTVTADRALAARAYENYASARYWHDQARLAWRRTAHAHGEDHPLTLEARGHALEAAIYYTDAKAQHYRARVERGAIA